jgi:exonuclease VII small subunit
MSATLKKLLLLSLALVLSLGLVAFVGCKEKLTQEEIDQIIAAMTSAEPETVSFDIDVPMSITVVGGSEPGVMTAAVAGSGVMDMVNKEMQATIDITADVPGEGEQSTSAEIYFVDDWMYVGMDIPEYGCQWMKMEATEEMWQQQCPLEEQLELWEEAVEVKSLGSETVNGVECYVYDIKPDMEVLSNVLAQETSGMGFDLSSLDLAELYQELSVREWLAQDNYLPMKMEIKLVMETSAEEFGVAGADFDKMTIDVGMTIDFYDYNQPVSIELPPEALEAEEMPQMTAPFPD